MKRPPPARHVGLSVARLRADTIDRRGALDYSGLDPGISLYVKILWEHGVETCESCQGGKGHSYTEPTVVFRGSPGVGHEALGLAQINGLPVATLRRVWTILDGEPVGPEWEMTFKLNALEWVERYAAHKRALRAKGRIR